MSSFGRRQQCRSTHERRRSERSTETVLATLLTTSDRRTVTLVDVSKGGAGLRASPPPERGRDVQLRVCGHTLFGRVIWRKDSAFGVRFDELLSDEAWSALEETVRQTAAQMRTLERAVSLAELSNKAFAQS